MESPDLLREAKSNSGWGIMKYQTEAGYVLLEMPDGRLVDSEDPRVVDFTFSSVAELKAQMDVREYEIGIVWGIEVHSEVYDAAGNSTGITDWSDLGEGPWALKCDASRYAESEVGVPWRLQARPDCSDNPSADRN